MTIDQGLARERAVLAHEFDEAAGSVSDRSVTQLDLRWRTRISTPPARRVDARMKAEPQAQQPSGTGVSSLERAVSAFVGYSFGAVVVLPFDRVKSLLQVSCQRAATL